MVTKTRDSIAISLFGNMTVPEQDRNNHSDTGTGTLATREGTANIL